MLGLRSKTGETVVATKRHKVLAEDVPSVDKLRTESRAHLLLEHGRRGQRRWRHLLTIGSSSWTNVDLESAIMVGIVFLGVTIKLR